MKKKILIGAGVLALFVLLGVWTFVGGKKLQAVHPRRGDLIEAIYSLGTVRSNRRFEVKIGVLATVTKLSVHEGDKVKKGDPLIQFDVGDVFRAPFDGTVVLVAPYLGEIVAPQTVALRMEDMNDRYIELSLEQEAALRIKEGQKARISLESLRGQILYGKVTTLFSRNSEFLARIDIPELDQSILPGMTADVSVEVGQTKNALLIPLAGVSRGYVTVRHPNGKREKIKVELGNTDVGWGEVKGNSISETDEILMPKSVD